MAYFLLLNRKNHLSMNFKICIIFLLTALAAFQTNAQKAKKKIEIVQGRNFHKDEVNFPGATIFNQDSQQVQFRHEGIDVWCNIAVYYQDRNFIQASGNVYLVQGDSVKMNCNYIEYDGNTRIAIAEDNVVLKSKEMTLTTEKLYFDRTLQQCYYNTFGTVTDPENVLTSVRGKYFIETEKFQFTSNVHLVNKDFNLDSQELDYYERSKHAYLYGPSTVTGDDYIFYCERGYYDTTVEKGYGVKKTRIDYDNRIIHGDSVYFDKPREFAAATNNIRVIDTINKGIVKGHYGEVWKAKDSTFVTKRAVAINVVENDSVFIHGDTLMLTGKENERVLRAYHNARFFKSDLTGKCDSIHSSEVSGVTKLIRIIPKGTSERDYIKHNPVLWNGSNQMTGDSIHIISNAKTEKLDSLKVIDNAFVVEKDTIGTGYNQVKGKYLYGLFDENNNIYRIDIDKNTESIYYVYDQTKFIGIDKSTCSRIQIDMADNAISSITNFDDTTSTIYRDEDLPENGRTLKGFFWRGDERIYTKDDIFDEDDENIELTNIRGLGDSISIDMEEMGRTSTLPEDLEITTPEQDSKANTGPGTKKLNPKKIVPADSLKIKAQP